MAVGGTINWDEAAVADFFTSESGDVARWLLDAGQRVTQEAKRLSPVSPKGSNGRPSGYLRSNIGFAMGKDGEGLYVDVASPAATPGGEPYGLFQEIGTYNMNAQPYLRPALDVLR